MINKILIELKYTTTGVAGLNENSSNVYSKLWFSEMSIVLMTGAHVKQFT